MATPGEIEVAARANVEGAATEALLTPRELAEAAWHPGSRKTVDQLEDEIRAERGLANRRDAAAS